MKKLKITETFYSLQGEGARAGEPSIFVRLAGCDMTCGFCDTEFASGKELSPDELLSRLKAFPCQWIVWTGGEPMLQVDAELVAFFKTAGYFQAIESNGNHPIPRQIDWITVSPKVAEHILKRNFPGGDDVDELRYVTHAGRLTVPSPSIKAKRYYLSPSFDGQTPNKENIKHAIKLCLENPIWRLSVQLHKILNIL